MEIGSSDPSGSADPTVLERGMHSAATGSILAAKIKLALQRYTVASASPNELFADNAAQKRPI
jgi:hypothetical protein